MRRIALIIAALLRLAAAPAASAADADLYGLLPSIGDELPNLSFVALRGASPVPTCPKFLNDVAVTYPFGSGSSELDKILAQDAVRRFADFSKVDDFNGDCPDYETMANRQNEFRLTFSAAAPGPGHLTVLRTVYKFYMGAAHPNLNTESEIFDLKTARPIGISEIFGDPRKAVAGLWPVVAMGWCQKGHDILPNIYEIKEPYNACGQSAPPLPEKLAVPEPPLSALGTVSLTPDGMTVLLDAYEAWSYADGPSSIHVPKELLIGLGASRDIWP
jgi:hypothetical protein